MRMIRLLECAGVLALVTAGAWAQSPSQDQVRIPNRPESPLFQGEQGNQKTEIRFDPQTAMVTVKMLVQDPNGYFIPNIRRENFAVYENGVRQSGVSVDIEHAPVSLGVLMEWGGHYAALNDALGAEAPRAVRQLLNELGSEDKVAIWRYGDRLDRLSDFSKNRDALYFSGFKGPEFSETNFYDALTATLQKMEPLSGRKALVLISTGVDTFSNARYEDALNAARNSGTPIYVLDLGPALRQAVEHASAGGPYSRIDWKRAQTELQDIAKSSGGRLYTLSAASDLLSVYDDIMENLKVRYVIAYKSSAVDGSANTARNVRIELVDPKTPVGSKVFAEASYVPDAIPTLQTSSILCSSCFFTATP